jgi:hypothetical protein
VLVTLSAPDKVVLSGAVAALRERARAASITVMEEIGGDDLG